ncbi:hypothetical protein VTN96DRAFT_1049 [Rasamsonia emersonii]
MCSSNLLQEPRLGKKSISLSQASPCPCRLPTSMVHGVVAGDLSIRTQQHWIACQRTAPLLPGDSCFQEHCIVNLS